MFCLPESKAGSWQFLVHRGAGCRHRCLYPNENLYQLSWTIKYLRPSSSFWETQCSWHIGTLCQVQTCGLGWTWVFFLVHVRFPNSLVFQVSQRTWLLVSIQLELKTFPWWVGKPLYTWPAGQSACSGRSLCEPDQTFFFDWLKETFKLGLSGTKPGRVCIVPLLVGNPCCLSCVNDCTLNVRPAPYNIWIGDLFFFWCKLLNQTPMKYNLQQKDS